MDVFTQWHTQCSIHLDSHTTTNPHIHTYMYVYIAPSLWTTITYASCSLSEHLQAAGKGGEEEGTEKAICKWSRLLYHACCTCVYLWNMCITCNRLILQWQLTSEYWAILSLIRLNYRFLHTITQCVGMVPFDNDHVHWPLITDSTGRSGMQLVQETHTPSAHSSDRVHAYIDDIDLFLCQLDSAKGIRDRAPLGRHR